MASIINGMSNAEYHASSAVSKSGLDKINISPAHYLSYCNTPHEQTEAMIFGSALHEYILEPHLFNAHYTVLPENFNGRTKDGKAEIARIAAAGQTTLKAEQFSAIQAMAENIQAHPKAAALLHSGQSEVSIFWDDIETGIPCRCRPDHIHPSGILVDLKTTQSAAPDDFAKSIAHYRYHVQDAFYSEGYYRAYGEWPKGFVFIAIEKTPPYAVAVYTLDETAKAAGDEAFRENLATLKEAQNTQEWRAYSKNIETLTLPTWAFK